MAGLKDRRWEWPVAWFLTVLWSAALVTYGMGYFGWFDPEDNRRAATMLEVVLYGAAFVLPLAMIWFAAYFLRQAAMIREETGALSEKIDRLAASVDLLDPAGRNEVIETVRAVAGETLRAEQQRIGTHFRTLGEQQQKLVDAIGALMKKSSTDQQSLQGLVATAQEVAERASRKAAAYAPPKPRHHASRGSMIASMDPGQEMLPFREAEQAELKEEPVDWPLLIRALNFPHDAKDEEGFAAIRKFLRHRQVSQVLQAAEDVLSMLAQEGIYMDDLVAEEANPDLWRAFAGGARGEELAEMATIEDQAAFTLTRGRIRTDQIFRDATLHFVRLFDRMLDTYIEEANDRDIKALARTRSGLAFIMLATINGAFE